MTEPAPARPIPAAHRITFFEQVVADLTVMGDQLDKMGPMFAGVKDVNDKKLTEAQEALALARSEVAST